MNKILLLILIVPFAISCSTPPPIIPDDTWKNLDIYSEKFYSSKDEIEIISSNKENRVFLYNFMFQKLDSFYLPFKEQLKLAVLFYCLHECADSNEYIILNKIIRKGHSHPTFYCSVLSIEPELIETSFEVLKGTYYRKAKLPDPNAGIIVKLDVQEDFMKNLMYATGLDMGYDYDAWTNWWHVEGKYLRYYSGRYAKSRKF